jgi:uncharacterized coiled-coil protein SlyX
MTDPSPDQDARIEELQSRLALADNSILELSNEVYRQQQQLAQLESQLSQLTDHLKQLDTAPPAKDAGDDIPPHY